MDIGDHKGGSQLMNGSGFYAKITVDLEKAGVAENLGRKCLGMLDRARFFCAIARKKIQKRAKFRTKNNCISGWQWAGVSGQ